MIWPMPITTFQERILAWFVKPLTHHAALNRVYGVFLKVPHHHGDHNCCLSLWLLYFAQIVMQRIALDL